MSYKRQKSMLCSIEIVLSAAGVFNFYSGFIYFNIIQISIHHALRSIENPAKHLR